MRSVEPKEALRLQQENNFVILDVRPEAEFKEVSQSVSVLIEELYEERFNIVRFNECRLIQKELLMSRYTG